MTVTSELGEPIHKVATRGVMLWKELDEKIFSLPMKEQEAAIQKNKAWIIERLNKDSMKVCVGSAVCVSVAHFGRLRAWQDASCMYGLYGCCLRKRIGRVVLVGFAYWLSNVSVLFYLVARACISD